MRAAENARIGEVVFIVASAKMFIDDPAELFAAIIRDLKLYCANGVAQASSIWVAKGDDAAVQLAWEKHNLTLQEFPEDSEAGLPETGW